MSVRCMSRVWEYSQQKGSALLLLLAIADNAKDNGVAWPGIEYLASKTRVSERTVMRLIQTIEDSGELLVSRELKYNRYYINVWPPTGPEVRCNRCGIPDAKDLGVEMHRHHIIPKSKGGSDDDDNIEVLCAGCHREHHNFRSSDNMSPVNKSPMNGDIPDALRDIYVATGDNGGLTSDTAMSPEPLLTISKPSIEPEGEGNLFLLYEDSIGPLTGNVGEELKALEEDYPAMWITDAFAIAKKNKASNLKYVTAILSRWNKSGKDNGYKPGGKKKGVDLSAFDIVRKELEDANA